MKIRLLTILLATAFLFALGCSDQDPQTTASPTPAVADTPEPATESAATDATAERAEAKPSVTTAIIDREVLFGNPERATARISPDGSKLAWRAPVDGVMNVWVAPIDDLSAAQAVTEDTVRGVRQYFWAYDNQHILYLQDTGGDENYHVYSANLNTGETTDLTPIDGVRATVQQVSHRHPQHILVGLNDRDPALHDIYRINIATGERELVLENPDYAGVMTDDDYDVRFGMKMTPQGGMTIERHVDGEWQPFAETPMEDMLTTSAVGFDKSGQTLYWVDSRDRNTAALVAQNLETGEKTVLFSNDRADVSDAMTHPTENTVEAVASTFERKKWEVLDDSIADDLAFLRTVEDGDLEVVSRSLDDQDWIVAYERTDGPAVYYHFDRAAEVEGQPGEASKLFVTNSKLENQPLAKMHPMTLKSRDGMNLVSYLTLPKGSDPDGDARPDQAQPLVLFVHGGPWARDNYGYHPYHQWLANRGYAVLSVNYRGSTGFGKDFINAANNEWAGKMHDDLIDAVNWAVEENIADPDKVAIMGGSYGGYATLVGMTFTPETFACGVDIVGPSSLVTLIESFPAYWGPTLDIWKTRVGDPETEAGKAHLLERSPLTRVDAIKNPLLIGQGANDPRVTQLESDQIVEAMQEKNIPVTYVLFPDEGHGFARPENRLAFNAVAESFLGECLGGRVQPVDDDFEGSSVQVPAGKEYVPGVADAMGE